MIITDIVTQKKNPKRVSIFIDNEFACGLSQLVRFEEKLEIGSAITETMLTTLIEKDQRGLLLEKAFRFISYRPRSIAEVRTFLLQKRSGEIEKSENELKIYKESIEKVITKLIDYGQLDDTQFARWWITQRTTFRPRGPRVLRHELAQKGVPRDVIDATSQEFFSDLGEKSTDLARKALAKKNSSYSRLSEQEKRKKASAFLARRGFDWETIRTVIDTFTDKK